MGYIILNGVLDNKTYKQNLKHTLRINSYGFLNDIIPTMVLEEKPPLIHANEPILLHSTTSVLNIMVHDIRYLFNCHRNLTKLNDGTDPIAAALS